MILSRWLTSVRQKGALANDEDQLHSVLDCDELGDLETDPQLRGIRDESVLEEEVAQTILGEICDGDAKAQLKVQLAEEEVKQAREVVAQKVEEVKQALEVVHQKQDELKKCRTAAAARKHFSILQRCAVMEEQEIIFWGAYDKIVKTREAMDEAVLVQEDVDDTASDAMEGA